MAVIALYVQKGETPYRKFFEDNLFQLQLGFQKRDLNLVFLPALTQQRNPNFTEGLRQYLEVYYPSFKQLTNIQQQQALFIVASTSNEFEVYDQLDTMFGLNLGEGAFIFYLKPGHFEFERLPKDQNPEITLSDYLLSSPNQIQASTRYPKKWQLDPMHLEDYMVAQEWHPEKSIKQFNDDPNWLSYETDKQASVFTNKGRLDSVLSLSNNIVEDNLNPETVALRFFEKAKNKKPDESPKDDNTISRELQRLFDTVNALQLDDALLQLVNLSVNRFNQINHSNDFRITTASTTQDERESGSMTLSLMQPLESVRFNFAHELFIGDQEISLSPICRALYKLFLNHPEGIELRLLGNHREELHGYYLNMATHTNNETLVKRIDALCNPLENSINEKLSTINKKFQSMFGPQVCLPYQILGVRGEFKKINLRREFVVI